MSQRDQFSGFDPDGASASLDRRARAGLLLRAIREFRRRTGWAVAGGCAPVPGGVGATMDVLRAALRLRYMSALELFPEGRERAVMAMLDPVTPHSKAAGIVAALARHGLPAERVSAPRRAGGIHRLRLKFSAVGVAFALRPWRRRLSREDLALVSACLVQARRMARGTSVTVHIGDRSPRRIALATGAALAGRGALYWQNGYHDREVPDLGYGNAAVLNAAGAAAFGGRATRVWGVDPSEPVVLRLPARIMRLGVATNAFAGPEIDALRDRIAEVFPEVEVALRLHPRIEAFDAGRVPGWDVRPRGESLEDFARCCDAVICGNTAAQIEILMAGTPVIHVAGLDPHGFDLYGYAARGISFGAEVLPEGGVEDALERFYTVPGWGERLQSEIMPPLDEVASLRDYLAALLRNAGH